MKNSAGRLDRWKMRDEEKLFRDILKTSWHHFSRDVPRSFPGNLPRLARTLSLEDFERGQ